MKGLVLLIVIFGVMVFSNSLDLDMSPFVPDPSKSLVDFQGRFKGYLLANEEYGVSLVLTFKEFVEGLKLHVRSDHLVSIGEKYGRNITLDLSDKKPSFTPFSFRVDLILKFLKDSFEVEESKIKFWLSDKKDKVVSNVLEYRFNLGPSRLIKCSTTDELLSALKNARPGDLIKLEPGVYKGEAVGPKKSHFWITNSGLENAPIILEGDSSSPTILEGEGIDVGYVLYIKGDWWIIKNLTIRNGMKGIMMDSADHNVLENCEIYSIGDEAVHLRDSSSFNIISKCRIHHTGMREGRKGYGEGVYIGSSWKTIKKSGYYPVCKFNVIRGNIIGPHVTAEHIDVKEFTYGTLIEGNTFYGEGISGEHYADSFIDIKGNAVEVVGNVFYRQGNSRIKDAIQLHDVVKNDEWAYGNLVYGNVFFLDDTDVYIINASRGKVFVGFNVRVPKGKDYKGKVEKIGGEH